MFHSQHNCKGDLFDDLIRKIIFTLIMNQTFIWAPKIMGNTSRKQCQKEPQLEITFPTVALPSCK